ncbi:MAG: carbohydrate kinase family protein [Anaerolineae bacterium]|nr:carbohydrate kinase family protein [Thermoflexales bacterium]MDW8293669.1 carbohydrate kinase family protein [Anaerolineae bacterium]
MSCLTPTLVCCGNLAADLVVAIEQFPVEADRAQYVREIFVEPGGAGNVLIMAARLGARAVALGAMGEDDYGRQAYAGLRAEGVDVSYVQRGASSVNLLVVVLVDARGRHTFLVREGMGASFAFGTHEQALVRDASLLFVPGYALVEPRMSSAVRPALECALEAGVPIVNDPGPAAPVPSCREALLAVIRASAFTLLNEDEACALSGAGDERAAADWLFKHGAQGVVIKRGARGCAVYRSQQSQPVEVAGLPVLVRDTTAAGDAFDAGFCVEWLKHGDPVRAARFANLVGAAKVHKLGSGRRCPTLAEIETFRVALGHEDVVPRI